MDEYNELVRFKTQVLEGKKIQITFRGYSIIDPEQALDSVQELLTVLESKLESLKDNQSKLKNMTVWQFRKWRKQP